MNQDEIKARLGRHAAEFIDPYLSSDAIIGVGTGTTADCFIDALADSRHKFEAAVASSVRSAKRLESLGIPVVDLNTVDSLVVYVDGADESNDHLQLIKGGGGAHTREKIVAAVADRFVCIVDDTKIVDSLGRFPLPVEVIPMARSFVARELVKLGGTPVWRENFLTDNGNFILDVHYLDIPDPVSTERAINNLTGVVSNGLFAVRPADVLLVGSASGITEKTAG